MTNLRPNTVTCFGLGATSEDGDGDCDSCKFSIGISGYHCFVHENIGSLLDDSDSSLSCLSPAACALDTLLPDAVVADAVDLKQLNPFFLIVLGLILPTTDGKTVACVVRGVVVPPMGGIALDGEIPTKASTQTAGAHCFVGSTTATIKSIIGMVVVIARTVDCMDAPRFFIFAIVKVFSRQDKGNNADLVLMT
jgi:hypothetical protein